MNWFGELLSKTIANLLIICINALLLKFFWNGVVPEMFHLPELTWTNAVFLILVCNILFKDTSIKDDKKED